MALSLCWASGSPAHFRLMGSQGRAMWGLAQLVIKAKFMIRGLVRSRGHLWPPLWAELIALWLEQQPIALRPTLSVSDLLRCHTHQGLWTKCSPCPAAPVKSQRQFWMKQKEQLYYFGRQRRTQQAGASKGCPALRGDSKRFYRFSSKLRVFLFLFVFLWPHPQYMESPG